MDDTDHDISRIAYGLWLSEGQPEGRDREHWTRAKEIWAFQQRGGVEPADTTGNGHEAAPAAAEPATAPGVAAPPSRTARATRRAAPKQA